MKRALAAAAVLGLALPAAAGDIKFSDPKYLETVDAPFALAAGDLNKDGNADIVIGGVQLAVHLGDGKGGLGKAGCADPPREITALVLADVDGDGALDAVFTTFQGGSVQIWSGASDGGWLKQTHAHACGSKIQDVAVADWNGDGKPDIGTVNGDGGANLLLTKEGGAFRGAKRFKVGNPPGESPPCALAAADVNADGKLDLVALAPKDAKLVVLLNDGKEGFKPAKGGDGPSVFARDMEVADFDGNGKPDAVVTNLGGKVQVLYGDGSGELKPEWSIMLEKVTDDVATGDLDGDGKPDFVVTVHCLQGEIGKDAVNRLVVFHNEGRAFSKVAELPVEGGPRRVVIADLNGDKKGDLVAVTQRDKVVVFLQK